jgi:hypothetical protein
MSPYRLAVLCSIAVAALAAPAARAEDKKDAGAPFVHTVIFYLKADVPSGVADELVADCHNMLGKIPTVRHLRAGKPSEGSSGLTKKDYAVGLMILFDDAAGFKTYADHPDHKKLVQKYFKYFDPAKLVMYDFVDAKK